jgi:hypothetical protein
MYFVGRGCYVCGICVYCGEGGVLRIPSSCWFVFGDSCVYHPLPVLLSYVQLLFCRYLGLNLLFTAVCLTLVDYFVVLYGSVMPWVLFELMLRYFAGDIVSRVAVNVVFGMDTRSPTRMLVCHWRSSSLITPPCQSPTRSVRSPCFGVRNLRYHICFIVRESFSSGQG